MRSEFEKAYEPNSHKSPFTEVRFNEEKQIYEPLNPPLDRVARSLNAAWYGYRIRQTEVDELKCELKRINSWYSNVKLQLENKEIDSAIDAKKIDELQKQLIEQGQRLNVQNQQIASLKWQLKRLGFTDNGGELMKPPIGDAPKFDLLNELQKQRDSFIKAYEIEIDKSIELQKRVDAVKGLAQTLWEKSEEKHQQGKVWESKTLGECADEILDVLEQALKGESNESST